MEDDDISPELYKVILLGTQSVGKTTLVNRIKGKDTEITQPTAGAEVHFMSPDKTIELQIYDTAGQETYKSLIPSYCRGVDVVLFVFDLNDPETINGVKDYYKVVGDYCKLDEIILFIIGNKLDLKNNDAGEQAYLFAEEIGGHYREISALIGTGVDDLFEELINKLREFGIKSREAETCSLSANTQNTKKCCN